MKILFTVFAITFLGCVSNKIPKFSGNYYYAKNDTMPTVLKNNNRKKVKIDLYWSGLLKNTIDTTFNKYGDTLIHHN